MKQHRAATILLSHMKDYMRIGADALASRLDLDQSYADVSNILICGMGGSGIVGDIMRDLTEETLAKPLLVCKRSTLPAFAGPETLLVVVSYSGGTIETISALESGIARGCRIIGFTSGGKVERMLTGHGFPCFKLPPGLMARESLPFTLFGMINAFGRLGWMREGEIDPKALEGRRERIESLAREIAPKLAHKEVVIYTAYQAVAQRLKSELNENAKAVARYDLITELCHNEINSWVNQREDSHILLLRDSEERPEVRDMVEIVKRMLRPPEYTEVVAEGGSRAERLLFLIWLGDFVSYYLAKENRVEPESIPATEFLRKEMSARYA